jgi:hypothetical protein
MSISDKFFIYGIALMLYYIIKWHAETVAWLPHTGLYIAIMAGVIVGISLFK